MEIIQENSPLEPPAPLRVAQVGPPCLTFLRHWRTLPRVCLQAAIFQGTSSSPQLLSIQELLPAVQESSWHSAQFIVHKSLIGFRRSPLGAAAEWIPSPKDQPSEPSLFPHEPWLLGLLPWPHSLCHSFCTGGTSFLFQ